MYKFEAKGTVEEIAPEELVTFRNGQEGAKRELVVREDAEKNPGHLVLEFWDRDVEKLDNIRPGDFVGVRFGIKCLPCGKRRLHHLRGLSVWLEEDA